MKKNKNAETMAGVLVSMAILSIIILGITGVIGLQENNNIYLENELKRRIIEKNIDNILKNLKIDNKSIESSFYIKNDGQNISITPDEQFKEKDFSLKNTNTNSKEKYEIEIKSENIIDGTKIFGKINIKKI